MLKGHTIIDRFGRCLCSAILGTFLTGRRLQAAKMSGVLLHTETWLATRQGGGGGKATINSIDSCLSTYTGSLRDTRLQFLTSVHFADICPPAPGLNCWRLKAMHNMHQTRINPSNEKPRCPPSLHHTHGQPRVGGLSSFIFYFVKVPFWEFLLLRVVLHVRNFLISKPFIPHSVWAQTYKTSLIQHGGGLGTGKGGVWQ